MSSLVSPKGEFVSIKIGYLAEGISKQGVEEATWFLLTAHKM